VTQPTHLKDLIPDPHNARQHNPRNVGMIEDALHEVGAARSIVIDENNVILAGNATIEAAASAGIEKVLVVETDGQTIVAVKRTGLTEEQKTRLALYDNRGAELASWDTQVLADLQSDNADLLEGMFYDWELDKLLGNLADGNPDLDELWQGMPEFEQDEKAPYQSIHVHFANDEDVRRFAELVEQKITPNTKSMWYPKLEIVHNGTVTTSDES
jgi:hypothetical protein